MSRHFFSLILWGVSEITPELSDALYEATGGDIELNVRDGVVCLDFDRVGPSVQAALTSAIEQVEQAGTGVRVTRVEVRSGYEAG